ncbi:MAG: pyrroloquinoline quinone biosynthesis protein PqqB, partial [Candidatus Binataceae bacterium]
MRILVLGAAAGGGFPQWNCNCANCRGLREGTIKAKARTQSSIAVSADNVNWAIVNTSPDILSQLKANQRLQPARALRDTGVRAVVLVDSQIDHTIGLAMLREGTPLHVYCTASVHEDLVTGNPLLRILDNYCGVRWHEVKIAAGASFTIAGLDGITFAAIPVRSKAPPYSPHREAPQDGDNIALTITETGTRQSLFYAPGLAAIEPVVWECMSAAECLLLDGTFWGDDEMIQLGAGHKRGLEMGHLAQSGPNGMLSFLHRIPHKRKILIHINNTNPILNEDSEQRRELARHGIEVAYDGMEILV